MPLSRPLRPQSLLPAWSRPSLAITLRSQQRQYRLPRSSAQHKDPSRDAVNDLQSTSGTPKIDNSNHSDGSVQESRSNLQHRVNGSRSVRLDSPPQPKSPLPHHPKGLPPRWAGKPLQPNPNLRSPPSFPNSRLQVLQKRAADEEARLLEQEWALEQRQTEDVPFERQHIQFAQVALEGSQPTATREKPAGTLLHELSAREVTDPNLVGNAKRPAFPRHVSSTGPPHQQDPLSERVAPPPRHEEYSREWEPPRQDVMRQQRHAPALDVTPRSLFEELFPEDKMQATKKAKERESVKLPAFSWEMDRKKEKNRQATSSRPVTKGAPIVPKGSSTLSTEEIPVNDRREKREVSVLVLSCALKSLEESDFFRLGPNRGEHIEGWAGGIIKVIPGRDNHSLQALGHYFILFSDVVSARAYMDNIFRLWKLANESTRHGAAGIAGFSFPPGFLKHGEDVQAIVRSFSLVPACTQLSLRLIEKPYKPAMVRLLKDEGRPPVMKNSQSKTEDMVLLYTDFVSLTYHDVTKAIVEDGRRRNLHWKLEGGPDQVLALTPDEENTDEEPGEIQRGPRRPQRFIISFKTRNEARRFAREWHQRPFPYSQTKRRIPGDEPPIVKTEILW